MTDKTHYRFALISDVHIDRENGGKNTYFIFAEQNFKRALDVIKRRGCDFIISAGDQITNASGPCDEWQVYRSIIDGSGYDGQIYEALGNHELRSAKYGINTLDDCVRDFIEYTKLAEKDIKRPDGAPYYLRIDPVFGDVFIFMALEAGMDVNSLDNFSEKQMDWVEAAVEKYTRKNRRIFLIQHANLCGYGAGDDISAPAYKGAIRTHDENGKPFKNNLRFKALIEKYRDIIWLSGHTHTDLADNVNYSDNGGRSCHMLHIPALAGTTRLKRTEDGNTLDRTFREKASQGYIVDVYEDKSVFSGINFRYDSIYPQFTYTIPKNKS